MTKRCSVDFIYERTLEILISKKIPVKDAKIFLDSMLYADLCGISTHGIRMLPIYIKKIDEGNFAFDEIEIIKSFSAFTVMNAKNNIGAISIVKASEMAVTKAEIDGIHTVFLRNSNTFGSGLYFVEKIANAGLIGLICCNSPAAMPAFNGIEAMLGTNPLSFAIPTKSYGNIVLDMATSVVAKSKFSLAKANGEKLEKGWALDKEGKPTVDPDEAIKGLVLPVGGFKGYGLSMLIDIISGLLSGSAFLSDVGKFYTENGKCMNVGQLVVAINPDLIYEGDFKADMDKYIEKVRKSKSISGKNIIIPGDRSKKRKLENERLGILLDEMTIEKLEYLYGQKMRYGSQ
ncbi:Ldh family oxidoreductase [Holdemania filiformis]|uniref:Ldh family oxidoreductase n=1 Tax=Holdemania filiformis TaxID=61171 RepID=UPI00242B2DD3|nr:Ldh family oxidoreductase [Holdemania filiformis]